MPLPLSGPGFRALRQFVDRVGPRKTLRERTQNSKKNRNEGREVTPANTSARKGFKPQRSDQHPALQGFRGQTAGSLGNFFSGFGNNRDPSQILQGFGKSLAGKANTGMMGMFRQSARSLAGNQLPQSGLWASKQFNMADMLSDDNMPGSWRSGSGDFGDMDFSSLNFSVKGNASRARGMEGALSHRQMAERAAKETGVPVALILAVIGLESGGRTGLTSPAGAQGVMQVMPNYWSATARQVAGSSNLMDPWVNIRTGAEILKQGRDRWGSWENSVKAYLAGTPHSTARDAFGTTVNTYAQIIADNLAWLQQRGIGQPKQPSGHAGQGSSGQGSSVWNIFGGAKHTVTQRYGNTSFAQSSGFYANNFHDGIDIGIRSGTRLHAPVSGTVEYVGNKGGYGGTVQIRTASGHVIKLSHMRSFNVRVGQRINAGTFLGESGGGANDPMRGASTGGHLHLTVYRPNGQHMDPMQFFRF